MLYWILSTSSVHIYKGKNDFCYYSGVINVGAENKNMQKYANNHFLQILHFCFLNIFQMVL